MNIMEAEMRFAFSYGSFASVAIFMCICCLHIGVAHGVGQTGLVVGHLDDGRLLRSALEAGELAQNSYEGATSSSPMITNLPSDTFMNASEFSDMDLDGLGGTLLKEMHQAVYGEADQHSTEDYVLVPSRAHDSKRKFTNSDLQRLPVLPGVWRNGSAIVLTDGLRMGLESERTARTHILIFFLFCALWAFYSITRSTIAASVAVKARKHLAVKDDEEAMPMPLDLRPASPKPSKKSNFACKNIPRRTNEGEAVKTVPSGNPDANSAISVSASSLAPRTVVLEVLRGVMRGAIRAEIEQPATLEPPLACSRGMSRHTAALVSSIKAMAEQQCVARRRRILKGRTYRARRAAARSLGVAVRKPACTRSEVM